MHVIIDLKVIDFMFSCEIILGKLEEFISIIKKKGTAYKKKKI